MRGASYQLMELLAQGGMGAVYLARYRDEAEFVREVAVKLLRRDVGEPEELGRRLRDEARLLGLLSHPAIVRVDRLALLDGRWALVMEYVEGLDLRQLASTLVVPTGVAIEVVEVVADALVHAGRATDHHGRALGLQHRDIKPSNIMVTVHGEVKVLDFGVAQARFQGRESTTQALQLGTADYMAPERLAGGEGSPAADIYSLGVVLWEVLAGERLGQGSPQLVQHLSFVQGALHRLRPLHPHAPVELETLLEAMLAWSPLERPDAEAVVDRCALLARTLRDPRLRAWCRAELRPRSRPPPGADGLVGSVLTPGGAAASSSLDAEPSWDDRTAVGAPPVPVSTGPSPRDGAIVPPDDEPLSDGVARPPPSPAPAMVAYRENDPPAVARRPVWLLALGLAVLAAGAAAYFAFRAPPAGLPLGPTARVEATPVAPVREGPPASPPATAPAAAPRPGPVQARSPVTRAGTPDRSRQLVPAEREGDGADGAVVSAAAPGPPASGSVWGESRPGGSLSTAGLAPNPAEPALVWGPQPGAPGQEVAWTDGVQVQLTGDALEVVLVDESRGFPVPGVVPAGSWFVRVRFGEGEPVVAGVVEIEGPGSRTLRCDAHLSWCSIVPR